VSNVSPLTNVSTGQLLRCPVLNVSPEHWRADGSCLCHPTAIIPSPVVVAAGRYTDPRSARLIPGPHYSQQLPGECCAYCGETRDSCGHYCQDCGAFNGSDYHDELPADCLTSDGKPLSSVGAEWCDDCNGHPGESCTVCAECGCHYCECCGDCLESPCSC
jgi:hypothetical protein